MSDLEQNRPTISVTVAKQFYKHALRTLALAIGAFSVAGGIAVTVSFTSGEIDPAYAIVSFLSWGGIAAAAVFALRKPPF